MPSAHPGAARTEPEGEIELRQRFGGAILDEDGNETPITEDMILAACQALEQSCFIGLHGRSPAH